VSLQLCLPVCLSLERNSGYREPLSRRRKLLGSSRCSGIPNCLYRVRSGSFVLVRFFFTLHLTTSTDRQIYHRYRSIPGQVLRCTVVSVRLPARQSLEQGSRTGLTIGDRWCGTTPRCAHWRAVWCVPLLARRPDRRTCHQYPRCHSVYRNTGRVAARSTRYAGHPRANVRTACAESVYPRSDCSARRGHQCWRVDCSLRRDLRRCCWRQTECVAYSRHLHPCALPNRGYASKPIWSTSIDIRHCVTSPLDMGGFLLIQSYALPLSRRWHTAYART